MLADGRVIDTSQPTFGDPYIIVYTVTNAAGLSASVRRTVEVADPCLAQFGTGWVYCTSTGIADWPQWTLLLLHGLSEACTINILLTDGQRAGVIGLLVGCLVVQGFKQRQALHKLQAESVSNGSSCALDHAWPVCIYG